MIMRYIITIIKFSLSHTPIIDYCAVVLAMYGNCAVSGLWNREVSAIQGALIHTGIGSCIWDFINCPL